jgi:arylformamidase
MSHNWLDISVPLQPGMAHWPGDSGFVATRPSDMAKGDVCNLTSMAMSAHTGTHMDAPLHFIDGGDSMDALPFDAVIGDVRVVAIRDEVAIGPEELETFNIQIGERIIFKTRNSQRDWAAHPFDERFVHINPAGAQYLVDKQIATVGVDYLSIGGFLEGGVECHQIMLGAGVWVIEGLDLAGIEVGVYEMVCLPLRLKGAEGSPARVVIRAK